MASTNSNCTSLIDLSSMSSISSRSPTSRNQSNSVNEDVHMTLLDGTFFRHDPEKSTSNKTVGICMKCLPKHVEIKGYNKSTSNFISHLKRKHGAEAIQDYREHVKTIKSSNECITPPKSRASKSVLTNTGSQENFDIDMVKYFIHSMIPLRCVEDPYFVQMFKNLNINKNEIKIMSRRSLGRNIVDLHSRQMCEIREQLYTVKYVCTTVDIWSGKKRSFLGVTVHWIAVNLQRKSAAIACRRFKGVHSYDRITELVEEINSDFGLDSTKILATVTDNGTNFVKAFKNFGVKITSLTASENIDEPTNQNSDSETESNILHHDPLFITDSIQDIEPDENSENIVLPPHLRCCAHTLNLCASADVKILFQDKKTPLGNMHEQVMNKCSILWNAAGRPKSAETIENVLGHTLSRPGATRWNSLYDALKQISKMKEKSLQLHKALGIKNHLRDIEFDYIEEYLQCAGPIANALDILQGDDTYYGIVLPCLLALRKKLQKLSKHEFMYCKPLIKVYLESVETRFYSFFNFSNAQAETSVIAALSYPRFKNKWFTCIEPAYHGKLLNIFKTAISKEICQNSEVEIQRRIIDQNKRKEDDFFDFNSDSGSETESNNSPRNRAEIMMTMFFAEESRELDLLHRYLEIKNIFIKYNTPLPSSGPVERMFSYATMTNLPKSHKLSDEMFEKRVVMKTNLNYFKK